MRISVFGIGYVGVVSCGCLAELGHEVVGVDISAEKIAMLASGRSPIVEEAIDTLIAGAVRQSRLTATGGCNQNFRLWRVLILPWPGHQRF